MKFLIRKREPFLNTNPHHKFAWLPTRISKDCVVWLESYVRRLKVIDEGNWASSPRTRWILSDKLDGDEFYGPMTGG